MCLALVCFLGFVNLYAQRINLSVAIVCMVNQTAVEQMNIQEEKVQFRRGKHCSSFAPCYAGSTYGPIGPGPRAPRLGGPRT